MALALSAGCRVYPNGIRFGSECHFGARRSPWHTGRKGGDVMSSPINLLSPSADPVHTTIPTALLVAERDRTRLGLRTRKKAHTPRGACSFCLSPLDEDGSVLVTTLVPWTYSSGASTRYTIAPTLAPAPCMGRRVLFTPTHHGGHIRWTYKPCNSTTRGGVQISGPSSWLRTSSCRGTLGIGSLMQQSLHPQHEKKASINPR